MAQSTLVDKLMEFSKIKLKKAIVKVPKLEAKKEKGTKQKLDEQKKPNLQISSTLSSVVNILIKAAIQRAKKGRKGKQTAEEKQYKAVKEDTPLSADGGYGTSSRGYNTAPTTSYIDYGKLFSYLFRFRAKNAYESQGEDHIAMANRSLEDSRFTVLNAETLDRITQRIKYTRGGWIDTLSLVPKAGMSSAEWEQFRLWMKLDPVAYGFRTGKFLR